MISSDNDIKLVLKFTIPLILSELSRNLMLTINRMVLARYSIDAMSAVTIAGNFVMTASFAAISISQIANVFVGQYYGKGDLEQTANPAWQMIYFALLSFLVFIPISLTTEHFCIAPDYYKADVIAYQKIMMMFAGFPAIVCSLSSFFIGTKRTSIIVMVIIIGNFVDFLLSMLLVFGIDGIMPSIGVAGAATATVISEGSQILILLKIFLNKENRKVYKTNDFSFRKQLFFDCIKIGFPISIGKLLELFAWFSLLILFSYTSKDLAIIESVSVSIFVIFIFFADGCSRAIATLSANLIGKNEISKISSLLKIFMKLNLYTAGIFSIPLVFFHNMVFFFLDKVNGDITHLHLQFKFLFVSTWITIFFDGIFYIIAGILTSGGDTKFQMYLESITVWVFVVLPTAIMFHAGNLTNIYVVYTIIPLRAMLNSFIVYMRYKSGKWINKLV